MWTENTKNAAPLAWCVVVNDSAVHGPFNYTEAVIFAERVIAAPGVTDVVVAPHEDDDAGLFAGAEVV